MTPPQDPRERLSTLVLGVHRRHGGTLQELAFESRLLDPKLGLDSLDLAEVMAAVEREFHVSPFEHSVPRTWNDIVAVIEAASDPRPPAGST